MSLLIFAVIAPMLASIEESISNVVKARRSARKLSYRVKQYKFN